MFYSKDILQKRGGKFGKLWLAATHLSKLTKRDIASVNVDKCCDDILTYVELRVPREKGRRPRFSLYLSALLMSGAVRIYRKQADYLFIDTSSVLVRVNCMPILSTNIDLIDEPRADQVTNPEFCDQLDTVNVDSQIDREIFVNNADIADMEHFWGMNGSTPPVAELEETTEPKSKRRKKQKDKEQTDLPALTVPNEQITIQDPPPLLMDNPLSPIPVPKELELPMLDGREMELLMNDIVEVPLTVEDLLPASTPMDTTTRRNLRSEQTTLDSPSIATRRQQDVERTPDRMPPPLVIPEERIVPPSPGVTQLTSPLPRRQPPRKSLELELTPMTPSPLRRQRKRQRKRQLTFADAVTQIPKAKMRNNLQTSEDTTTPFTLADREGKGAADLLAIPGDQVIRKKPWLTLWERNARFRRNIPECDLAEAVSPVPEIQPEQPEFPALDQQLQEELLMPPVRPDVSTLPPQPSPIRAPSTEGVNRSRRTSTLEQSIERMRQITSLSESLQGPVAPELSSMEIPRDGSTLLTHEELQQAGLSLEDSLLLDESRKSKNRDSSVRKRRRGSSLDDQSVPGRTSPLPAPPSLSTTSTTHTSVARTLYDVVEEPRFEPQFLAVPYISDEPGAAEEEFLRKVQDDISDPSHDITTFFRVCPPRQVDRKQAAAQFAALLNLCASRHIIAEQEDSYTDIYIRLTEDI